MWGGSVRNGHEKVSAFPLGAAQVDAKRLCGAANEQQPCVVTQERRGDKEWGVHAGAKKGARRFGGQQALVSQPPAAPPPLSLRTCVHPTQY